MHSVIYLGRKLVVDENNALIYGQRLHHRRIDNLFEHFRGNVFAKVVNGLKALTIYPRHSTEF